MPIAPPLLARLHDLSSLTNLLGPLGITPRLEVLDPARLDLPGSEAAILGRLGAFQWLGVSGPGVAQQARRVAVRLSSEGRTAGLMALDATAGVLSIAVTLERTMVFEVDPYEPLPP